MLGKFNANYNTFMPLIFVAQAQEVKSQDNPVMQDRSWNLTRRSFEPPIQPVQQKKEAKTQICGMKRQ
jgi:hypothetical protein